MTSLPGPLMTAPPRHPAASGDGALRGLRPSGSGSVGWRSKSFRTASTSESASPASFLSAIWGKWSTFFARASTRTRRWRSDPSRRRCARLARSLSASACASPMTCVRIAVTMGPSCLPLHDWRNRVTSASTIASALRRLGLTALEVASRPASADCRCRRRRRRPSLRRRRLDVAGHGDVDEEDASARGAPAARARAGRASARAAARPSTR